MLYDIKCSNKQKNFFNYDKIKLSNLDFGPISPNLYIEK